MALHWQHIKGFNGSTAVYTNIEFSTKQGITQESNPQIWSLTSNTSLPSGEIGKLGYIITSDATNQNINQALNFINGLKTNSISSYNSQTITFNSNIETACTVKTGAFTATSIKSTGQLNAATANISGQCTAQYFNATSDKRAKENIIPFEGNALDVIKKLQTYTFNYLESSQRSYGIIAQDLVDIDINGFSFVENKDATGINGDYMSIKESKLIYLLIEAVKEQQIQIEQLRKELEELKNGK